MHAQEQPFSQLQKVGYALLWTYVYCQIPYVFLRRQLQPSHLSLQDDLNRSTLRAFFNCASYQQLRYFAYDKNDLAAMVLQSTRFGPYNGELYQLVSRKGFSGYWVVQGSLNKAKEPKTSDIVLYYIHGGGYVAFAVANFLGLLLALWESANAINPNVSISIFALEYDMSPEAQYPIALEQAVSGYNYLVSDAGIDPRRIVLGGDSAGGHLAVSLLSHIHNPRPGVPIVKHEKPGFGLFLSPWLEPYPSKTTSTDASPSDTLDDTSLAYWAQLFYKPPPSGVRRVDQPYLRPLSMSSQCVDALPAKTEILTGSDDTFKDDCVILYEAAKIEGADVALRVEKDCAHNWQWLESGAGLAKYLSASRNEKKEADFKGAKEFGSILVQWAADVKEL